MSENTNYRILARKYRPTSFDELVGQNNIVDTISNSIRSGRLSQAYLFTGIRGVGKTTTARALSLLDPKTSGTILFNDSNDNSMINIDDLDEEGMKNFRRNIQMIFQDPYESLNPRWNIKDIILEPLNIHNIGSLSEREDA